MMGLNHLTEVRPRNISQDMSKRKNTPKKNNVLNRKKYMTTHQIVIVNQAMRPQSIKNLMARKASLSVMTSQLTMLKNKSARRSTILPN